MAESDWVDDPTFNQESDWVDVPEQKEAGLGENLLRGTLNALPVAGAMFGGAAGTVMGIPSGPGAIAVGLGGAGLGAAAGESLKNIGEKFLLDEEKSRGEIYGSPAKAALDGVTAEMGGQALAKGISLAAPAIRDGANSAGKFLRSAAEKFTVNSTGATGAQASKFADDAGAQLLDRGLVKFGDSAENIAKRTADEVQKATNAIDGSLKSLDAKGVQVSADKVVQRLQKRISQLRADPSQADVVKKLESIVLDIVETGNSNVPISQAEVTKRGFNKMAGDWTNPIRGQAGKEAYLGYMDEVENAAQAFDPALAKQFTEGKETFGLLRPIQEAAERRASTLNQSPLGGLGDIASEAVQPGGSVLRRLISPRISSSAAVTLDKVSKALMSSPRMASVAKSNPNAFNGMVQMLNNRLTSQEMSSIPRAAEKNEQASFDKDTILNKARGSKYQAVLDQAAQNGDQSLAAAHFVLSQRDGDYRKILGE